MFMLLFKPIGLNFPLHETESPTLDYSLIPVVVFFPHMSVSALNIQILLPCLGKASFKSRPVELPAGSLFPLQSHPGIFL